MGSMQINFADVDSFEPLPEDYYDVEVDKVEVRRNKDDDGDYLNWELIVLDGEYENRRLWKISSLKKTALSWLKDTFVNLDVIDPDDEIELEWDDDVEVTNQSGPRVVYPELEGLECIAVVKNRMFDGKERNNVEELLGDRPKESKKSRRSKSSDNEQVSKARSRSRRNDDDDDDEEEERRPRKRSKVNDDDEAPRSRSRSRKSRDDDEEDDDDEDEEDERPRRRSTRSGSKRSSSSATKNRRRRMR